MGKALFITGTGTDIGKTYVTGLLVKKLVEAGYHAGYYKAALSGAEEDAKGNLLPGDALFVKQMAKLDTPTEELVSYIYREAVSPHLAAQINHLPIDFDRVEKDFQRAKSKHEYLTMEGSGGIICPLRWDEKEHVIIDDLILRLKLPVLIIADAGLGTINAAVLTIEHLQARKIPVRGVILNNWTGGVMQEDNRKMIEEITGVRVLCVVPHGAKDIDLDAKELASLYA